MERELDLETLEVVKLWCNLYSDYSSRTLAYKKLCSEIKRLREIQNTENTVDVSASHASKSGDLHAVSHTQGEREQPQESQEDVAEALASTSEDGKIKPCIYPNTCCQNTAGYCYKCDYKPQVEGVI